MKEAWYKVKLREIGSEEVLDHVICTENLDKFDKLLMRMKWECLEKKEIPLDLMKRAFVISYKFNSYFEAVESLLKEMEKQK